MLNTTVLHIPKLSIENDQEINLKSHQEILNVLIGTPQRSLAQILSAYGCEKYILIYVNIYKIKINKDITYCLKLNESSAISFRRSR